MRRLLTLSAIGLAALVWPVTAASAHADLASSDPASGATLATPPTQIALTFTEAPDPSLSTVKVRDANGIPVATGPVKPAGPQTLSVSLPEALPDGVYTVSWRSVSADDGHLTAGSFSFGVSAVPAVTPSPTPAAGTSETPGPTLLSIAAKILLYAGLMLLVAVAAVGLGAFRGAPSSLRIVEMVAGVLSLAGAALFLVAEQRTVGVPMADLLRSPTGRPFLWLLVTVLAANVVAVLGAARERWRPAWWVGGALAAVAIFVRATGGHAAAASAPLVQETIQWVHFLAAGLWLGGLVLLALLLRERADQPPVPEAGRYSALATVTVGVVVATGLIRAMTEIGGPSALSELLDTSYGRTLAIKAAVAAALVALGAVNRFRLLPRLTDGVHPLRRMLVVELVVAVGVLVLTATLTGLDPR